MKEEGESGIRRDCVHNEDIQIVMGDEELQSVIMVTKQIGRIMS